MLAPKLEAMSNELSEVEFYKINVDNVEVGEISQLAKSNIEVLPTFIICQVNGELTNYNFYSLYLYSHLKLAKQSRCAQAQTWPMYALRSINGWSSDMVSMGFCFL